jgi:hypothetical protein
VFAHTHRLVPVVAVSLCLVWPDVARAARVTPAEYMSVVTEIVTELAPRSAHDAAAIREAYRPYVTPLALDTFADIEEGLATGGLVPLSQLANRFNVRVRRDGAGPVGEMDVPHQESYVSARPATAGCLIDVASRVKSGPIEITSLVRHLDYQNELRASNPNATTDVPTHALGLAFDIAIVNTPLPTVLELEDVLREMSDAGDILVIAERQQLVFHVVPQPARLGWYTDVYARAINGEPWGRAVGDDRVFTPMVNASIASLQPAPAFAAEWWAAANAPLDMAIAVSVQPDPPPVVADSAVHGVTGYVALLGEFLSSTWHKVAPWTVV